MKKCKRLLIWSMVMLLTLGSVGSVSFAEEETVDAYAVETEAEAEEVIEETVVETVETVETEAEVEIETDAIEETVETEAEIETEVTEETVETEVETEEETEEDEVELMAVPQVTGVKASSSSAGVTLKWSAVTGVTGYKVKRKGSDGKYHLIHKTTKLTWVDPNASTQKYELYKVCAYKVSTKTGTITNGLNSASVKGIKKLPAVSDVKATSRFNGVRITWTKKKAATGYKIYGTRYGKAYQLIGTTTSSNYLDVKAPIEGVSSYVVYPYVLVDGKKVVGDKSVTVKATTAYYYSSVKPTPVKGKVSIYPYSFYFDQTNKRYVAECYILNGRSGKVTDINMTEVTFSNDKGVNLCSRNFGKLSVSDIPAGKYVTHKFYFPEKYISSYTGTSILKWYTKVTYIAY